MLLVQGKKKRVEEGAKKLAEHKLQGKWIALKYKAKQVGKILVLCW